jgi:hypothetical protein
MTVTTLPKQVVLDRISHMTDQAIDPSTIDTIRNDPRDEFKVGKSPAHLLRSNLESNYKLAKASGKSLDGDEELLLRLSDLSSEMVMGIVFDAGADHTTLFLLSETLEPIARVIVSDARLSE